MSLSFPGGLPPRAAPVSYLPQPSNAADARTGKEAGYPTIRTPHPLSSLSVTRASGSPQTIQFFDDSGNVSNPVPSAFQSVSAGVVGEGMTIGWEPAPQEGEETRIHFQVKLLPIQATGTTIDCPDDPGQQCGCHDDWDVDRADFETDLAFQDAATRMRSWWCDPDYEPDPTVEGRHYRVDECRQGLCYPAGGDRDNGNALGSLYCMAEDSAGSFELTPDMLNSLASQVDMSQVGGAVMLVARANEKDIMLPATATAVGGVSDINPVRLRSAHVVVGRLAIADGGAQ
jgi:hypothetical protein